jgi:ribonuclease Z
MDAIRLTFLGTGAAAPTRERNVSSLAVTLDGRTLLFDCGEGTQHQIQRSNIRSGAIDAVFITHLHGDHLFGLPGLIATLGLNGRSEPLTICGPKGLHAFLTSIPYLGAPFEIDVIEEPTFITFRGYDVMARRVDHSVDCFAYCVAEHDLPGEFNVDRARELEVPAGPMFGQLQRGQNITLADGRLVRSSDVLGPTRAGRRIAFVTDTRPCQAAVDLARDADLLIHEATYANDHADDARTRFHSTAQEAAQVARAAQSRSLVLTHISARYDDATQLCIEAAAVFQPVVAAHDLMELPVVRSDRR